MLKCTLHKYISYVECVCRIFGTFKIDRCDVFSTRYANGLFDRSQKKTWSRVVNGAQSDGKKEKPLIGTHSENKQFTGVKKYAEGWTRSRTLSNTCGRETAHIHFVCIKRKYVYEWRNQFGYLELIINSQI